MHKKIIFLTLISFFHLSSFADYAADQKVLLGGIMITKGSLCQTKLSEQEKKDKESTSQPLKQMIRDAGFDPARLAAQCFAAASVPVAFEVINTMKDGTAQLCAMNTLYGERNAFKSLYEQNKNMENLTQLLAKGKQIDGAFNEFTHDFSNHVLYGIPRVGIKAVAGEVGSQMLSKNVYKQILYKHIIYSLVDATACPDKQAMFDHLYSVLPAEVLRGATIEATSWALTEYIFDAMEKTEYDPFKLSPYQLGKSELLHIINPILKDLSKMVVHAVLCSYVVAPAVWIATGGVQNEVKLCMLSLRFGDL